MNTIPEFVKQGFLQEYRCIYSGFEDDLDKIKGKENNYRLKGWYDVWKNKEKFI